MTLTMIYLMVILKIPLLMLLGIVRWAWKSVPEEEQSDGGGGETSPAAPIRPRSRGPHGDPRPPAPQRVRTGYPRTPVSRD